MATDIRRWLGLNAFLMLLVSACPGGGSGGGVSDTEIDATAEDATDDAPTDVADDLPDTSDDPATDSSTDEETDLGVECTSNDDCVDNTLQVYCDPTLNECVECFEEAHCEGSVYGPFCDLEARWCIECGDDEDCSESVYGPACHPEGYCVECNENSDCMGNPYGFEFCLAEEHYCVECEENANCAGNPFGPVCDPERGLCVNCMEDEDCEANELQVACKPEYHNCVECTSDEHCVGNPWGDVCDPAANWCVECRVHSDCFGNPAGEACYPGSYCGPVDECETDADCDDSAIGLHCDLEHMRCVQCLDGTDCEDPLISVCLEEEGQCVECIVHADCMDHPDGGLCQDGLCGPVAGCTTDDDCEGDPWGEGCDTDSGDCVECVVDDHCSGFLSRPACDQEARQCVECNGRSDCVGDPEGPICDDHRCVPDACLNDAGCSGDPRGSHCDTDSGDCVECLLTAHCSVGVCDPSRNTCLECVTNEHCTGNPDGAFCGPGNECGTLEGCSAWGQCDSNPDGDLCIPFEERCGECWSHTDCEGDAQCTLDFTCTGGDTSCAELYPDRPYELGEECVACLNDLHCGFDFCSADNECVDCVNDTHCADNPEGRNHCLSGICRLCSSNEHCTDVDEPFCNNGYCYECAENSDCTGGGFCRGSGFCEPCNRTTHEGCSGDTPYCMSGYPDDRCVECILDSDCMETEACQDDECRSQIVACSRDSQCEDNDDLDECDEDRGVCVECTNWTHCIWEYGTHCDDTIGECVHCLDDGDCDSEEICSGGFCIDGCRDDGDCDDDDPYCRENLCSPCAPDACVGDPAGEHCHPDTGQCVECLDSSHCTLDPAQSLCNTYGSAQKYRCVECLTDDDCTGGADGDFCLDHECSDCRPYGDGCELDMVTYICGSYVDLCGAYFDCGECGIAGTCTDGGLDCDCAEDENDDGGNNDTFGAATDLGDLTDSPDSAVNATDLTIHSDGDVDWYTFDVEDAGVDGNPDIHIVTHIESPTFFDIGGEDDSVYEITVWLDCAEGGDDSSCTGTSSEEDAYGVGCFDVGNAYNPPEVHAEFNCSGTSDESGTVTVRVRKTDRYGLCDAYRVAIQVE